MDKAVGFALKRIWARDVGSVWLRYKDGWPLCSTASIRHALLAAWHWPSLDRQRYFWIVLYRPGNQDFQVPPLVVFLPITE